MSNLLQAIEGPGDAELISAVRGGDLDAYGQLFERHVDAARRLARQLVSPGDVDDLVSDAFAKVLGVMQRGGGPDVAFRAYLLTAVRRLRVDRFRAGSKVHVTDDMEAFDPGVPFRDTAVEGFENAAAAQAFASLPERWQAVLWHTEVEGQKPAEVALILGMTPNSVSALAYRAREGLRQAFLTQHANELDDDTCRWTHQHLGAYVRDGLARRDSAKVEQHVQECRTCAAIYLELTEVNSNLSAVLGPLLLGGFAAAYVASGTATTGLGAGLGLLVGRVRDLVLANAPAAAAAGVASTAVVTGAVFVAVQGNDGGASSADAPLAPVVTSASRTPGPPPLAVQPGGARDGDAAQPLAAGGTPSAPVAEPPASAPLPDAPTAGPADPTVGPTADPTDGPTQEPTADPTDEPTQEPTQEPSDEPTRTPTPTTSPTPPTAVPPVPSIPPVPPVPPADLPTTVPPEPPAVEPTDGPAVVGVPDLSVSGTSSCVLFVLCSIDVTVSGMPVVDGATLTAAVDGPRGRVRLTAEDDRCDTDGDGNAFGNVVTCALTPEPYTFSAFAIPGSTVTFTAKRPDADPITRVVTFDGRPPIG